MLYVIFGIYYYQVYQEFDDVFLINFFYLLAFSIVILILSKIKNINLRSTLILCFLFNLVFGTALTYSIESHTNQLFQYVPSDSPFYDEAGREISKVNLIEGVQSLVEKTKYGFDDMGMVFYVGAIYKIYDSPLLVKIINLL